jgi:hypothetical protein
MIDPISGSIAMPRREMRAAHSNKGKSPTRWKLSTHDASVKTRHASEHQHDADFDDHTVVHRGVLEKAVLEDRHTSRLAHLCGSGDVRKRDEQ